MDEEDFIEKEKLAKDGKLIKIEVKDLIPELTKLFSNEFLERKGVKISPKPLHDRFSMSLETKSDIGFPIKIKAEIIIPNLPQKELKGKKVLIKDKFPSKEDFKKNLNKSEEQNKESIKHEISNEIRKGLSYQKSIGWRIHNLLKTLEFYKYFFDQNYLELLLKIFEYKENLSYLYAFKQDGKRNLDYFVKELARYLHNYLMSFYSLLEKTRGTKNHINKRFKTKISDEEYTKKLNEYKTDEYSKFLNKCRKDFAHKTKDEGLSQLSFDFDFKNVRGDIYVGDKSLAEVIMNYNDSINQFYNWYFNTIIEIFADNFEITKRLIQEYNGNIGIQLKPGKSVKKLKEYECCQCGETFKSSKPMGLLDKDNNLMGYICEKCKILTVQERIKSILCTKCNSSLKDERLYHIKSIKDDVLGIHIFYKCPFCHYEGHLFLKIGRKELKFIKKMKLE